MIGIVLTGYYQTKFLKVKEYNIVDKSIPDSFNGFKIIHFGDILFGSSVDNKYLNKVVKEINKYKPDIVVFTGDLFSKENKLTEKNEQDIIKSLKSIKTTLGKYAIYGDNDIDNFENIMIKSDFTILKDNYKEIYYNGITPIIISNSDVDFELFNIRLVHKPDDIDDISKDNINVILSGHSLTGQIRIPFYGALFRRNGAKKYTDFEYSYETYKIFITSGLGTYSPNIRLLNSPSINLYRLTNY